MNQSVRKGSSRSWSRIDGIDSLRALAIFYVLMNHVNMRLLGVPGPRYYHGLPHQLVTALVWQGQSGVQIFFAVSGFLITSTTIKRWGSVSKVRLRDFYLIRFARIAPLLLTLLTVLSILHAFHIHNFVVSPEEGGLRGALVAALTLRIGLLEATKGYLPGNWDILWSLSVEEMFYLFFPVACRLLRGKWLLSLLAIFVALGPFARTVFTHGNPVWREYSYLGGMDAIALGCLTAIFVSERRLSRPVVRALTGFGLALLVFCLVFAPQLDELGLEKLGLGMTVIAVGACMIIAAATETRWTAPRVFSPLLAYGRRSYEIYLTHMFVVFILFDVYSRAGGQRRFIPLFFIVGIVVSGVLGELVARFYSEPANRWLRARFGDGPEALGSVVQADS